MKSDFNREILKQNPPPFIFTSLFWITTMSIKELLGLDKLGRLRAIIKFNGGIVGSLKTLYR